MTHGKAFYLGTLGDFGLGNPEGIPSSLAGSSLEERVAYGQRLLEAVVDITDKHHLTCIDGRFCKCNADGSSAETRRAQVAGTGALTEVAVNAGVIQPGRLSDTIKKLEGKVRFDRSAHLGGCGGVNGAIPDNLAIGEKPAILEVTQAVMDHEALVQHTHLPYDKMVAEAIRRQAPLTAAWMKKEGWEGQKFVDGVKDDSQTAGGVEDLLTDDSPHRGHNEPAIALFYSVGHNQTVSQNQTEALGLGRPFVGNLDASQEIAEDLGEGDTSREVAVMTANVAKHVATGDRLASPDTPVYLLVV